jgi:hypothetical protein
MSQVASNACVALQEARLCSQYDRLIDTAQHTKANALDLHRAFRAASLDTVKTRHMALHQCAAASSHYAQSHRVRCGWPHRMPRLPAGEAEASDSGPVVPTALAHPELMPQAARAEAAGLCEAAADHAGAARAADAAAALPHVKAKPQGATQLPGKLTAKFSSATTGDCATLTADAVRNHIKAPEPRPHVVCAVTRSGCTAGVISNIELKRTQRQDGVLGTAVVTGHRVVATGYGALKPAALCEAQ